jgi:glycosyltransferase involved in cell wall biosynthesis
LIKLIKRLPLAIWIQDLWPQSLSVTVFIKSETILKSVAAVTSWIYRRSDLLLVQSQAFIPEVRAMANSVPIIYHPNPGDLLDITPSGGSNAYFLGAGFNVVFAGNVGHAQSPETLLEVARCLSGRPHIRLIIVGGGSRLDWLVAQAEKEGLLNLKFAGRFPSSAMPDIFAQASALLVILGRESVLTKTIPSKIPSYMAAAKPIIGSIDGEGARVLREAGAGLVVPAADAQKLVAAILTMSEADEAALAEWGQAGQRYFNEHFHPGKLAEELKFKLEKASTQYER